MKPVKAWAFVENGLITNSSRATGFGDYLNALDVFDDHRMRLTEHIPNGLRLVRVEIREVKARKGVARDNG